MVERARELRPDDTYVLQLLSRLLENDGHWHEAYDVMRHALKGDPRNAGLHHRLGVIAQNHQNLPAALSHFENALGLEPTMTQAALSHAGTLVRMERYDDAFERLIEIESLQLNHRERAIREHILALAKFRTGDLDGAATLLEQLTTRASEPDLEVLALAAEVDSERAQDYFDRGYNSLGRESRQRALMRVRRALQISPNDDQLLALARSLERS